MKYIPLSETPASFYEEVGMISGLEIHQQVLTKKKLFCRCPAGIYSTLWDAEILRHMRPTLSELGEYDGTALMEFKTRKEIIYQINKRTVCTYEFDDTPPFAMNEDALDIALEVSILLNLNLVSELHIARKQYLDGSIPTGFQRTTILGVDGWIPFRDGRVRIRQLGLEEDACREVSDEGHVRTYITDRLGMPLIETVTYPDMKTPQDVAAVGEILRRLVRSTRKMRTGPGAARQDVNVSVRGGTRVEIKGVSSIKRIPTLVHNEAFRQIALLEIRDELARRKITAESFSSAEADLTEKIGKTRFLPILHALEKGGRVYGVLLRGFEGLMRHSTGPGRSFFQEFCDRVRVVACIDILPNAATTDLPDGNLSPESWKAVRSALGASAGDAAVLVWGARDDAATAAGEIALRAREAVKGVPSETRQAMPDGTTGFERVLPGPDRMYPDTDLPPKPISDERMGKARAAVQETPWSRLERYARIGVPAQLAQKLSISPHAPAFDRVLDRSGASPGFAAGIFADRFRQLEREGLDLGRLGEEFLARVFSLQAGGKIHRDAVLRIIVRRLCEREETAEDIVRDMGLSPASGDEISAALASAVAEASDIEFKEGGARLRFVMGRAMSALRCRVDGAMLARDAAKALLKGGAPSGM